MMIAEYYVKYVVPPDREKRAEALNSSIIPTIEQFRY
jgi:hypothetical protein